MAGLFSTFNIAVRGMSVQQKAIDTTSHNIANANTEGFSRQRINIETTRPFTGLSYSLGTGADVTEVLRVRDSFMDYQIRNEMSTQGLYTTRDSFLSQVESIFNEPSDTGISSLMGKFFDAFQELSKQPQDSNARTVAAEQSSALCDSLNHVYNQLTSLKGNAREAIESSIIDANSTLSQIDDLNKQIMSASITGNSPNDLMDKRDLLIDQLSSKFNIVVEKGKFNGVDIKPADGLGINNTYLIKSSDTDNIKKLSYIDSIEPSGEEGTYNIVYYRFGDRTNPENRQQLTVSGIDSEEKLNEIESTRVLVSDAKGYAVSKSNESETLEGTCSYQDLVLFNPSSGELKGNISVESDVDDYINEVNKLAKTLAFAVNSIHSGITTDAYVPDDASYIPKMDHMPFFINSGAAEYNENNEMTNLGTILSSESEINAGNISVNKQILFDVMNIKTRTNDDKYGSEKDNNIDGNKDGERALAISKLRDSLIRLQDMGTAINSRYDLFDASKGGSTLSNNNMTISNNINGVTMDSYFKDIIDKLGIQEQQAQRIVKNQDSLLSSLKESKESVSGVSIDEEVANIVQYQHAYQANAKVITVIDELLDVVVNGLIK
ncbi:MAG: flagellar hook-associated protein FlgK [Bacillota bacterium]|nr:flagellar hook-associated protein FlgK [Bacillota bacterium]